MSFCSANEFINEGDVGIIYLTFNQLYPIKVTKGLTNNTKYGVIKHVDLIGKRYGSKINCSKGSVYIIQGSPEQWTLCLPHRTQILYTPNISFITLQLELKPGSIVFESGTGSGSLSHAIIRSIQPTGHLHTFDFHEQRCNLARQEFKEHHLNDYVTVSHRDVCRDGFGVKNIADAVFLDLPNPWNTIIYAKEALKTKGGRICSFSPCIEQVQKTVEELTKLKFSEIQTIECLRRVLSIKKYMWPEFDFNLSEKKSEEDNKTNQSKKIKKDLADQNDVDDDVLNEDENIHQTFTQNAAKAINLQPGHTGFLTFATLSYREN